MASLQNLANSYIARLAVPLQRRGNETTVYLSSLETLTGETITTNDFAKFGRGILTINPLSPDDIEFVSFTGIDQTDLSATGAIRGLSAVGNDASLDRQPYQGISTPVIISFGVHNLGDLTDYLNEQIALFQAYVDAAVAGNLGTATDTVAGSTFITENLSGRPRSVAASVSQQQLQLTYGAATNPSNGNTFIPVINGTPVTITFKTNLTPLPGEVKIQANAALTKAIVLNLLQNPGTTNSNQVALAASDRTLVGYLSHASVGTTIVSSQKSALLTSITGTTSTVGNTATVTSQANMTLRVNPFTASTNAVDVSYAGGNTATFMAPVTNPRIDLIVYDTDTSALAIRAGSENASPVKPTPENGDIVLCSVYHRVGETKLLERSDGTNGYILSWYIPTLYQPNIVTLTQNDSTGADGALNITSGTTTLNDADHVVGDYAIYNYTSGNISIGATLATGANLKNKILVLKFNQASTLLGTISRPNQGGEGGAMGVVGSVGAHLFPYSVGKVGATSISSPGLGGLSTDFTQFDVWCGSGGAGGVKGLSGGYDGGLGGDGGGGFLIFCAAQLSISGLIINLAGEDGTGGAVEVNHNYLDANGGGGGGGGGAGSFGIFASSFAADTSKYVATLTGGAPGDGSIAVGINGGSPPAQTAASGSGGGASGINAGSNGSNGGTTQIPDGSQGRGGAGANGRGVVGILSPLSPTVFNV